VSFYVETLDQQPLTRSGSAHTKVTCLEVVSVRYSGIARISRVEVGGVASVLRSQMSTRRDAPDCSGRCDIIIIFCGSGHKRNAAAVAVRLHLLAERESKTHVDDTLENTS
jgi:hypothetical protein